MSRALFVKQFSSDLCKGTEEEKGIWYILNDRYVIENTVVGSDIIALTFAKAQRRKKACVYIE